MHFTSARIINSCRHNQQQTISWSKFPETLLWLHFLKSTAAQSLY